MLYLTRSRVLPRHAAQRINDINEINYKTSFVDDEKSRENINREYALTLTELFPTSLISSDDVERYRQKHPLGYGAELTCDQLSKRYGVTSFSTRKNDVKMWSHYADHCRGIVIGYNVDLWVRHLIGTSIIRQVKYADDLPIVMGPGVVNQENAYAFMSSKGAAWEYEQEWRLISRIVENTAVWKGYCGHYRPSRIWCRPFLSLIALRRTQWTSLFGG